MMRTVLCLLLGLFAVPTSARAPEYDRYKLFELVACADLIVTGTIRSVSKPPTNTFDLEVDRVIAGSAPTGPIRVERFKNWTCASRWAEYAEGQHVLIFLARPKKESQAFKILGGGGEGEMPMVGPSVCVRGYSVRGHEPESGQIDGRSFDCTLVAQDEFVPALQGFREAYVFERGRGGAQVQSIRPKQGLKEVQAFAASSATAAELHEEALSSTAWSGESTEAPARSLPPTALRIEALPNHLSGLDRFAPGRSPDQFGSGLQTCFGSEATFIGDVDGNGTDDLAVGAPSDCYNGHFHGALWILLMTPESRVSKFVEISERQGGFPARFDDFGRLGGSIAPLTDLDGDGIPDLAVGSPLWGGLESWRGGIWLLFLARDGTVARSREIGSDPKLAAAAGQGPIGIGRALANLGDLDGDGLPEIAIGTDPQFDFAAKEGRAVLIASLGKGGEIRWATRIHDRLDGFHQSHSWFGEALAALGDVDGDSVPDVAIANTYDDDGGEVRGSVWIVFLTKDGRPKGKQKLSDWKGGFEGVLHDWSRFGTALGGPGDLNGDGVPDLLASSTEGVWSLFLRRDGTVSAQSLTEYLGDEDHPVGSVGTSIAVGSGRTPRGLVPLAIGGTLGRDQRTTDGAVWFLGLDPTGVLTTR